MDLLTEAKKSNKSAYEELIQKYNHIFYKTVRLYYKNDVQIYHILEIALIEIYKDIINAKDERDFLCFALQNIINTCEKFTKNKKKKNNNGKYDLNNLSVTIADKITSTESNLDNLEYQAYRKASPVEDYITSINENYRLVAILYYYADLTPEEISKILKCSVFYVNKKIKGMRTKLYEIIKNKEVDFYNEYV